MTRRTGAQFERMIEASNTKSRRDITRSHSTRVRGGCGEKRVSDRTLIQVGGEGTEDVMEAHCGVPEAVINYN